MNTIDFLTDIIPISSALLSLIASIAMSYITKKITSNEKKDSIMTIKLNDKKIEINGYSEKELIEIITKLKDEDKPQKDSVCKKES